MVPLSPDDIRYIDELIVRINAMIAGQAAANDADFVDTYRDSGGHDVCKLPPERWFEGLVPTEPAYPLHPNAKGEASMARSAHRGAEQPAEAAGAGPARGGGHRRRLRAPASRAGARGPARHRPDPARRDSARRWAACASRPRSGAAHGRALVHELGGGRSTAVFSSRRRARRAWLRRARRRPGTGSPGARGLEQGALARAYPKRVRLTRASSCPRGAATRCSGCRRGRVSFIASGSDRFLR